MPAAGDQHKPQGAITANPFDDAKTITPYTAAEIATLQARLDKQLGPEFISSRPGASGQKVYYLAGEKVINLANEVFGFNGWSSAIQNIQIDFVDEHPQTGKVSLGLSVIVRVTLKDGTYHEDIGYGHIENCKGKAAAFAKAKKEGTTDAMKRALRTFGNVLGNCLYDKDFLGRVTKMKVGKGRWDESELYRHPDFAPAKRTKLTEPEDVKIDRNPPPTTEGETSYDEGFDIADFDDAEFEDDEFGDPDHIVLPDAVPVAHKPIVHPMPNSTVTPSKTFPPRNPAPPAALTTNNHDPGQANSHPLHPESWTKVGAQNRRPVVVDSQAVESNKPVDHHSSSSPSFPSQHFAPQLNRQLPAPNPLPQAPTRPPVTTFYSARAAQSLDETNVITGPPNAAPRFNPHAESPSIRKTAGVDHNKSVPLRRDTLAKDIASLPNRDFVEPRSDMARRVGAPNGQAAPGPMGKSGPGPGFGTSAYRPPTRRGPEQAAGGPASNNAPELAGVPEKASTGAKRAPLSDVSNMPPPQSHGFGSKGDDPRDAKRPKIVGLGQLDGGEHAGATAATATERENGHGDVISVQ